MATYSDNQNRSDVDNTFAKALNGKIEIKARNLQFERSSYLFGGGDGDASRTALIQESSEIPRIRMELQQETGFSRVDVLESDNYLQQEVAYLRKEIKKLKLRGDERQSQLEAENMNLKTLLKKQSTLGEPENNQPNAISASGRRLKEDKEIELLRKNLIEKEKSLKDQENRLNKYAENLRKQSILSRQTHLEWVLAVERKLKACENSRSETETTDTDS